MQRATSRFLRAVPQAWVGRRVPVASGSLRAFCTADAEPEVPRKHAEAAHGDPTMPVTFGDISAASFRIRGGVPTTPVQWNKRLSREIGNGISIALKREFELPTGSFKERGALNALLCMTNKQRKSGVIAASAGNHAAALAYHSGRLGIACTVVMPTVAPLNKIQTCEDFGANVIVQGAHIGEAREVANGIAESTGALYINGFDDPAIIAGAGTMGLEIMSQCDGLDALVIPVGGGGLIAGVAAAVKSVHPDVLIIGAEPEILPSMSLALQNGGPVETPVQGGTLADGLWVPRGMCCKLSGHVQ